MKIVVFLAILAIATGAPVNNADLSEEELTHADELNEIGDYSDVPVSIQKFWPEFRIYAPNYPHIPPYLRDRVIASPMDIQKYNYNKFGV